MPKNKIPNINKNNLSKIMSSKIGISEEYSKTIINDLTYILINIIKDNELLKVKNFGTFKVFKKKSRTGRNPKTKEIFEINSRKVANFSASIYLKNKINQNV